MQEITVDELRKRGVITETIPGEKRVYRLIKGYEAKNYDGTHLKII